MPQSIGYLPPHQVTVQPAQLRSEELAYMTHHIINERLVKLISAQILINHAKDKIRCAGRVIKKLQVK